jgi:hypothetical protein
MTLVLLADNVIVLLICLIYEQKHVPYVQVVNKKAVCMHVSPRARARTHTPLLPSCGGDLVCIAWIALAKSASASFV